MQHSTHTPSGEHREKSIWFFQDRFDLRNDLEPNSLFYVALETHRGEYSRREVLSTLQLDAKGQWRADVNPKVQTSVLFGGHIGCGKSTELRQLRALMSQSYTDCAIELTEVLDINNLRYSDLLIALGHEVAKTCTLQSLPVNDIFLKPVLDWFDTRILKKDVFTDLDAEIKAEAKTSFGIPLLSILTASFTSKVRTGASYREELRREVNNGFTALLGSFNALIAHVNELLKAKHKGPLLFIIDGLDKLKREDSKAFFQEDASQLLQIQTHLILCAPISVLLEDIHTAQRYDLRARLPMVKIADRDTETIESAVTAMMAIVTQRLPLAYFDSVDTVRYLAILSGGHPRDLMRLVRACFLRLDGDIITRKEAERAVRDVATEYQRALYAGDCAELVKIDTAQGEDIERSDARLRMLYDLVLLEYNSYWWRSHPLVRTLKPYTSALAALTAANTPSTPRIRSL
jgi:energy-coupling factor transporter ATP-binding protein EcfA2